MITFQSSPRASRDSSSISRTFATRLRTSASLPAPLEVIPNEKLIFQRNAKLAEQKFLIFRIRYPGCPPSWLFQNALCVHSGQLYGDGGICRLVADLDLPDFRRPAPALAEDDVAFPTRNRRLDCPVVQRSEAAGRQSPQRFHIGARAESSNVLASRSSFRSAAARVSSAGSNAAARRSSHGRVPGSDAASAGRVSWRCRSGPASHRKTLHPLPRRRRTDRLLARCRELENVLLLHSSWSMIFSASVRAAARRDIHQGFNECRAERVNPPESSRIGIARQQHIHHLFLDLLRLPESIVHLLPGGF